MIDVKVLSEEELQVIERWTRADIQSLDVAIGTLKSLLTSHVVLAGRIKACETALLDLKTDICDSIDGAIESRGRDQQLSEWIRNIEAAIEKIDVKSIQ